jgi:hypothetical protein
MMLRTYRILCSAAILVAVLAAATALAAPAAAAGDVQLPGTVTAEQPVVAKVAGAQDSRAAFQALSTPDSTLFVESFQNIKATTISSGGGELPSPAAGIRCWYHYQYDSWSDLTFHEGDTWMQLDWCSNGRTITSFRTSHFGGRGDSGVTYVGVKARGYSNVGWEARSFVEFHFNFFRRADAYPCMQIRGGHTGLYSTQRSCNLG